MDLLSTCDVFFCMYLISLYTLKKRSTKQIRAGFENEHSTKILTFNEFNKYRENINCSFSWNVYCTYEGHNSLVSSVSSKSINNSLTASPHRWDQGSNCLGEYCPILPVVLQQVVRFVAEIVFALNVCPIHPNDAQWDSYLAIWTTMVALQYWEFGRKQLSVLQCEV